MLRTGLQICVSQPFYARYRLRLCVILWPLCTATYSGKLISNVQLQNADEGSN